MTGRIAQGADALELLLSIRLDGFITGYASALLTMLPDVPRVEELVDRMADEACQDIENDPLMMEAQRQEIIERLAGVDSGPITLRGVSR